MKGVVFIILKGKIKKKESVCSTQDILLISERKVYRQFWLQMRLKFCNWNIKTQAKIKITQMIIFMYSLVVWKVWTIKEKRLIDTSQKNKVTIKLKSREKTGYKNGKNYAQSYEIKHDKINININNIII